MKTKMQDEVVYGLEDVCINTTKLTQVDGIKGRLYYLGYPIEDIIKNNYSFEEVAYLFLHGRFPRAKQLKEFKDELSSERELDIRLKAILILTPQKGNLMALLQGMIAQLAMYDPEIADRSTEAKRRKALRIIARMPTAVTFFHRVRSNLDPVAPKHELSHAGNMLYMLTGKTPAKAEEDVFEKALILHMDHECNASTFASRIVASTEADIYSSVIAAIGALSGPLHGGANERVLRMLREVRHQYGDDPSKYIEDCIKDKKKIMGFGHRVYKTTDPRATILRKLAKKLIKTEEQLKELKFAENFADTVLKKLQESGKTTIYPNVDFFSGVVYEMLNLPLDFFTPTFAIARVVGWIAHYFEQTSDNRIYRPRLKYIGPKLR